MCLDTIEGFFRKDKTMKKITSILLSLVLCFSMSANVFASEISTEQEPVSVITVADENGKDVEYELYNNSITNIPIYAAKEGDTSRALTEVATLTIGIGDGFAAFTFTPSNVGIALLTVGFTGDFTTYLSGIKYGYNSYIIPVWRYFHLSVPFLSFLFLYLRLFSLPVLFHYITV